MGSNKKSISTQNSSVAEFLDQVAKSPVPIQTESCGRLIFAMDATASREPCWDMACQIQADMFTETAALGKLLIQLCYYHGYGEFQAHDWTQNASQLQNVMSIVRCKAGQTQISRILDHTLLEAKQHKINALVFVGDCMEELADKLLGQAGKLALHGIPIFIFHEGQDVMAERTFRQMAKITKGAYCKFDQSSAEQLRALLKAVAVYAVGGVKALKAHSKTNANLKNEIINQLTDQSS